jgi:hypothetical protein
MPFHWRNKGIGRLCLSWAFDQMTFGLEACCKLGCLGCSTCSCHFMSSRLANWGSWACTVHLAGPFKLIDFECPSSAPVLTSTMAFTQKSRGRGIRGALLVAMCLCSLWTLCLVMIVMFRWLSSFCMNHFSTCLCLFWFTKKERERETGRERERCIYIFIWYIYI